MNIRFDRIFLGQFFISQSKVKFPSINLFEYYGQQSWIDINVPKSIKGHNNYKPKFDQITAATDK
jgi:hypothetical protein